MQKPWLSVLDALLCDIFLPETTTVTTDFT